MYIRVDSPSERTTDGRTQLWNYLASFQVCDIASWHGRGGDHGGGEGGGGGGEAVVVGRIIKSGAKIECCQKS